MIYLKIINVDESFEKFVHLMSL